MDVGVGDVNADDLEGDALAEGGLVMAAELLDGIHDGDIIGVAEVVEAVNFGLRDDEGVAGGFGGDV